MYHYFQAFINNFLSPKEQFNMQMALAREKIRENQTLPLQKGAARSSFCSRILTNSCNTSTSRPELCFGMPASFQEHKQLLKIGFTLGKHSSETEWQPWAGLSPSGSLISVLISAPFISDMTVLWKRKHQCLVWSETFYIRLYMSFTVML